MPLEPVLNAEGERLVCSVEINMENVAFQAWRVNVGRVPVYLLDANLPEGRAHDMVIVGSGASQMEDRLAAVLKTQGRAISPDPEPEKGGFYRSDHISLAKVGVPMLDPGGGYDLIDGGKAAGQKIRDDYRINHYHQPSDEWKADWDLSGPVHPPARQKGSR